MSMRLSDWIVVVYFLYLTGAAAFVRVPVAQRLRIVIRAALVVSVVIWLSRFEAGWLSYARNWAPLVYLFAAYRTSALLVSTYRPALEQRLAAFDSWWLRGKELAFADRAPHALIEILELAYLFCYPLIPVGWMCLHFLGGADQEERYWTAVTLAATLCYGALPWLPTRPPRATKPAQTRHSSIRSLNLRVLNRMSIQLNTFPSGHVATAFAAALAVAAATPVAGIALALVALAIMTGSVVGRYHYAADVLAGVLVALVAFAVSRVA